MMRSNTLAQVTHAILIIPFHYSFSLFLLIIPFNYSFSLFFFIIFIIIFHYSSSLSFFVLSYDSHYALSYLYTHTPFRIFILLFLLVLPLARIDNINCPRLCHFQLRRGVVSEVRPDQGGDMRERGCV